jgi:hypothetical protein
VEQLKPAGELAGHSDLVRSVVAAAPDRLASASADGTALLWKIPALPAGSPAPAQDAQDAQQAPRH